MHRSNLTLQQELERYKDKEEQSAILRELYRTIPRLNIVFDSKGIMANVIECGFIKVFISGNNNDGLTSSISDPQAIQTLAQAMDKLIHGEHPVHPMMENDKLINFTYMINRENCNIDQLKQAIIDIKSEIEVEAQAANSAKDAIKMFMAIIARAYQIMPVGSLANSVVATEICKHLLSIPALDAKSTISKDVQSLKSIIETKLSKNNKVDNKAPETLSDSKHEKSISDEANKAKILASSIWKKIQPKRKNSALEEGPHLGMKSPTVISNRVQPSPKKKQKKINKLKEKSKNNFNRSMTKTDDIFKAIPTNIQNPVTPLSTIEEIFAKNGRKNSK